VSVARADVGRWDDKNDNVQALIPDFHAMSPDFTFCSQEVFFLSPETVSYSSPRVLNIIFYDELEGQDQRGIFRAIDAQKFVETLLFPAPRERVVVFMMNLEQMRGYTEVKATVYRRTLLFLHHWKWAPYKGQLQGPFVPIENDSTAGNDSLGVFDENIIRRKVVRNSFNSKEGLSVL